MKILSLFTILLINTATYASEINVSNKPINDLPSMETFIINNLWILIGAVLVFAMHPGFALLETGLTRAKNSVNILTKNIITVAIGLISYVLIGFSLMYPGEHWIVGHFLGFTGFGLDVPIGNAAAIDYNGGLFSFWTDFIFQGMFAATSVTIVSGAVAERMKIASYAIFALLYATLAYPIIGSWGWGGGWLKDIGFYDLAGSTFVHSVGGWGALMGAIIIGPRIGKYVNGKSHAIPGSNLGFATLGVFLLWFGWFGFNGASVFSADPVMVAYVFTTTALSASSGLLSAMLLSWFVQKKPDLSMILNGCPAGLVGITASADCVSINSACFIGFISGIIVVLAVYFFDRIRIDDPVGAISVHLVCGIWGTLAVGIFSPNHELIPQIIGIISVAAASIFTSGTFFMLIKKTAGLRVSKSEELKGLDISEHGMEAYHGFQIFSNE